MHFHTECLCGVEERQYTVYRSVMRNESVFSYEAYRYCHMVCLWAATHLSLTWRPASQKILFSEELNYFRECESLGHPWPFCVSAMLIDTSVELRAVHMDLTNRATISALPLAIPWWCSFFFYYSQWGTQHRKDLQWELGIFNQAFFLPWFLMHKPFREHLITPADSFWQLPSIHCTFSREVLQK